MDHVDVDVAVFAAALDRDDDYVVVVAVAVLNKFPHRLSEPLCVKFWHIPID